MNIYIVVYVVISRKICSKKDILYTRRTKIQRKNKNGQPPKRSTNQTNQRTTRPHSSTTLKRSAYARLSNNHKNTQNLRSILRTKHSLPSPDLAGEKRPSGKQMEHGKRKTTKSLRTDKSRKKRFRLHRKLTQFDMPENRKRNKNAI
jgi:hypothetical protein